MENLVTLTINGTHFYLIDCKGGKLLIDAGWEIAQFNSRMKTARLSFAEIRLIMFTHHHPDHAGLVQNIKDLSGAKLIIHQKQIPYLEQLRGFLEKKGSFVPVRVEKDDLISPSREVLRSLGIAGEIVETPGHSDDSISLVLDSGSAFIGDLPAPEYVDPEIYPLVCESWKALLALGAQVFYHSHTDPIPAQRIRDSLSPG